MHQKLLWGGAVVVVMGVTAGFLAVNYVARHPGSVLARFGVSVLTAGLNPNPLCDSGCVVDENPTLPLGCYIEHPPQYVLPTPQFPIQDLIEPIQIDTLPPATIEPPIFEESEWRPLTRPIFPLIIDETPIWMPYADETLQTENVGWFALMWRQLSLSGEEEQKLQVDPGQQLIDPPAHCGKDSTLSWDHRNLFDPSKCEAWCPLLQVLRACCLPWLGLNWFEPLQISGQEEQRMPPIVDDPGQQLIDPLVRGWWRKGGNQIANLFSDASKQP